jgi:hypothetical protein
MDCYRGSFMLHAGRRHGLLSVLCLCCMQAGMDCYRFYVYAACRQAWIAIGSMFMLHAGRHALLSIVNILHSIVLIRFFKVTVCKRP